MPGVDLSRLRRLAAGAFLVLLIEGAVAPASVWAGCGHPVGSQSDPFRELRRFDSLLGLTSASLTHEEPPGFPLESPINRRPCSGMSCSSRDSLPISTGSPRIEGPHQWVALVANLHVDGSSPAVRIADEPAVVAIGEKTAVFHPPRA